jgi:type I restriction enzyme R subunit
MPTPEDKARQNFDAMLVNAGWVVQDYKQAQIHAGRGVALRNFPLSSGHWFADYLLYVDGKAAGIVEAKKEGFTLTGVELEAAVATNLTRAGNLRQGILNQSFKESYGRPAEIPSFPHK